VTGLLFILAKITIEQITRFEVPPLEPNINQAIVLRLARYLRVLRKLKSMGFIKVFSNNLGDATGVTPAVVRKDLSAVSIQGHKRGGYQIDATLHTLERVLGKDERQEVVIVGCGKIGRALMSHPEFQREGIQIVAGFDINPNVQSPDAPIPILPMSALATFVHSRHIDVVVLTVPDNAATEVFDQVVAAGIPGVLNFTSIELKFPPTAKCRSGCVIHHVNIGLEIENLFYLVRTHRSASGEPTPAAVPSER
jgi:redox-sensing transcriptional repressor